MGRDPAWYDRLPRASRDRWDQAGHFAACWGIATLGTAAAAWAWAHRREFYGQWPPRTDALPVLYVRVRPLPQRMRAERVVHRETGSVEYLPGARVRDTRRDLDWMLYGAIAGQVTQVGWVTGLVVWLA